MKWYKNNTFIKM